MTIFKIIQKEKMNMIVEIVVDGHADSNNVVCAGISMATIITANAIKYLNMGEFIDVEMRSGYFRIKTKVYNDIIDALLRNLKFTLKELAEQYPLNIHDGGIFYES